MSCLSRLPLVAVAAAVLLAGPAMASTTTPPLTGSTAAEQTPASQASSTTSSAATTPASSGSAAAPAAAADPDRRVCRQEQTLGSRLRARRVCLTESQWRLREQRARESGRDLTRGPAAVGTDPKMGGG